MQSPRRCEVWQSNMAERRARRKHEKGEQEENWESLVIHCVDDVLGRSTMTVAR